MMTVSPDIHRFIFSVALLTPINLPVSNSWQATTREPNNDSQPFDSYSWVKASSKHYVTEMILEVACPL